MDHVKRIWYLWPVRAAKVQASLRIRAVSPEPSLLAHISSESRGTFRQKARSLAPLNGCACAVKICHDGMLEDTNSLDGAHMILPVTPKWKKIKTCFFESRRNWNMMFCHCLGLMNRSKNLFFVPLTIFISFCHVKKLFFYVQICVLLNLPLPVWPLWVMTLDLEEWNGEKDERWLGKETLNYKPSENHYDIN